MQRIIYYHKGCPDGFGAAWAAWIKLGYSASYIPITHSDEIPEYSKSQIYFLDICPSEEVLTRLQESNRVVILDHHKSAEDTISKCKEYIFDNNRSGAGISWDYFCGNKRRPTLINIIEDRDLWKWNIEGSREVLMLLDSIPKTFEGWSEFSDKIDCPNDSMSWGYERALSSGSNILEYQKSLIKVACSKSYIGTILGNKTAFVNSSILQSFIGNELLMDDSINLAAIFYKKEDGYVFSLRSRKGGVDCSKIAEEFGGGGHHCASGFKVSSLEDLRC